MGLATKDDGWRLTDEVWERIEPLLPVRKPHPLGCHNPRVADRDAMNAILFLLRTGCQWNALDATGICSCSSAYRRFREWTETGVFEAFWRQGLIEYDGLEGIDWSWLFDGWCDDESSAFWLKKTGANPTDRGKQGPKRSLLTEAAGIPLALSIDGANRHDMKLVRTTLDNIMAARPLPTAAAPQGLCLDKGYNFDEVSEIVREFGFTAHIRARGEEAKAIKAKSGFQGAPLGGGTHS